VAARTSERSSSQIKATPRYKRIKKAFGLRLRRLRQQRGWTLQQAADATNLDLKHLQKLEAGTHTPTLVTLLRLADGLGVTIAALFEEEPGIGVRLGTGRSTRGGRRVVDRDEL
jgi:transcriptional regulator with XRE-family HTH domain